MYKDSWKHVAGLLCLTLWIYKMFTLQVSRLWKILCHKHLLHTNSRNNQKDVHHFGTYHHYYYYYYYYDDNNYFILMWFSSAPVQNQPLRKGTYDNVFCFLVHFLSVPSLSLRLLLLAGSWRHQFEEECRPQRAQVDGHSGQASCQHHVFAPVTDGLQDGLSHVGGVPTRRRVLIHDWRWRSTREETTLRQ